jgi:DNA-binding GntR family transcriptional regulator
MALSGISRGADVSSLADNAYRRIEEMIVIRQLAPGTMISESRLGEELGCGRTPIREALLRLKFEGYVEIYPSRGAMVSNVDVLKQLELLEVRRPLDDLVSRLAAKRAATQEKTEMLRLGEAIRAAAARKERMSYLHANRAIHEIKARATRNSMLEATLAQVNGLSRRFWYAYVVDADKFSEAAMLHDAILQHIVAGAGDDAAKASSVLLDFLESLTRNAIERGRT